LAEVSKVLNGFICSSCCSVLEAEGLGYLVKELSEILAKDWLGDSTDPDTPAGIAYNLGYDLFATKGLKATAWENLKATLHQEWVKQLFFVIATIIVTALLALIGLKR
jgi:hypothetical protein